MALAKTTRPRLSGVFPRKRLFRELDRGRKRPITWVQGPPGAGKTTLVASYIQSRKLNCLWYQVDEGDADVATFFYHLRLAAPRGRRPLPLLTPEYLPGLAVFTQHFFRELFSRLKTPFVLTLDNYQDAPLNSNLHEALREAFAQLPDKGHAIVISRTGPPPAMARLQASRAMSNLTGAAIRLTFEEARGLARLVTNEELSRATVQSLYETVDGWAAGLILMLQREDQTLRHARGRHPQEVFNYFDGEILSKADRETQEVLLQTAFLPRVTVPMAVELTGLANAGQIIDDLAREHYFTTKHDSTEPTYQYHPLFREFLLVHARRTFAPNRRVQVQKAAAALLEKAGHIEDAVRLLSEADDWETLARLIQEHAPNLVGQGRGQTLEEWLASLPEPIFQERPWLLYWRGICRTPFDLREGRGYLEKAFDLFRSQRDSSGAFLASSAIVVNLIQETDDLKPIDKWIGLIMELRDTIRDFPSIEIETRVTIAMILAMTARQPHHEELPTWVERGEELSRTVPDPGLRSTLMMYLGCYYYWIGDFTKISVSIESFRDIARSDQAPIVDRLMAFMFIGRNEWLTVSPAAGIATISRALELAKTAGVHVLDRQLLFDCAVAALNNGDQATAERYLQEVRPLVEKLARCDLASYHYVCALCALLKRNFSIAFSHQEKGLKLAIETGMPLFEAICHLLSAEVLHGRGDNDAAWKHIFLSLELARKGRARFVEYMALLTEAQVALDLGKERKGLQALSNAMTLGRVHGYFNIFTWRADVMARLCAKALETGIEVEYVQQLIRKRGLIMERPSVEIEQWPWAIKIYTLGRFSLLKDDEPVRFSRKAQRKPIDLLKALIAFGGRNVVESQVIEALWPEAQGDVAHQSLSTTLHRLRRLLGRDETIRRQEGKLSLDDRLCWVDVWAVEGLLARAETATSTTLRNGDAWPEVEKLVEKAVTLYHGPFLGEEEYSWAIGVTERVERRLLRVLRQVGRHHEQDSVWEKAIDCYERAIQIAPCTEELYRRLITVHQQLGRRVEALAVYERCRRTLSTKMGLAPSRETEALYRSIRSS